MKRPRWMFLCCATGWIVVWRDDTLIGELRPRGTIGRDYHWWLVNVPSGKEEAAGSTLAKAKSWVRRTKLVGPLPRAVARRRRS